VPPSHADAPPDDVSIADDAVIWRRVPDWHFVRGPDDRIRPSSAAFDDDPDGDSMSAVLATPGRDPAPILLGNTEWGLVAIKVSLLRELGWRVERTPRSEEPAHVHVHGDKTTGKKRRVAKECVWVIPPPPMR
jgi:hypothetical protein